MPNDNTPVHDYFARLGLEPEIADIYLALHAYGSQSLLQLSRNAGVERTRLYRLLDTLAEYQLVETEEEYKRKTYKAAPIGNIQVVLAKKDQELRDLRDDLASLRREFEPNEQRSPVTRVQFYRGQAGVRQMFWNQTRAQSETLSVLYENMQARTNSAFFERWVRACNEQNLTFRSLVGDHFMQMQREWYVQHDNEKLQHWEGRYVPNPVFPITHSMIIYDDVVAYYNWKDDEIFGVEMYNQEIAQTQRQYFEMLWQQGRSITGHGEG